MQQYILRSFVSKNGGGNKSAVVFDDFGMSESQMLRLAKKNNFSETAFIDFRRSDGNRYQIRYFTPEEEVDICGHAALAAFHLLRQLGYLKGDTAYHKTKAGELKVLIDSNNILIEMKKPELVMKLDTELVLETIDIGAEKIVAGRDGFVNVISTGLKDIILEVTDIDTLKSMRIKRENMISVCQKYNLIGMHVVSRETIEKDSDFCCRNFAPAVGIDEESATGTSNASLLYYMIKSDKSFDLSKTYKIEQGYFMNSPSNIFVRAEKDSIFVGGSAVIDYMEDITVE